MAIALLWCGIAARAAAQDTDRLFAGALFGFSILSVGTQSDTSASEARLSVYEPANGPAGNVFAGVDVAEYFSVQGNWMWNRNAVTLISSVSGAGSGAFYRQERRTGHHAVVLDGLLYFRRRDSAVRPYLGTGLSLIRFTSAPTHTFSQGLSAPAGDIDSSQIGLRSHVGVDIRITKALAFRYSFSETISADPVGPSLTPARRGAFMNFQNLFGVVSRF